MKISLWKCDFDAGLSELRIDGAVYAVPDGDIIVDARNIDSQFKLQTVVPEGLENNHRRRVSQDQRVCPGYFIENLLGFCDIRAIGNPYDELSTQDIIRQGPVDQTPGDKLLVRYNQLTLVPPAG